MKIYKKRCVLLISPGLFSPYVIRELIRDELKSKTVCLCLVADIHIFNMCSL